MIIHLNNLLSCNEPASAILWRCIKQIVKRVYGIDVLLQRQRRRDQIIPGLFVDFVMRCNNGCVRYDNVKKLNKDSLDMYNNGN